MPVTAPIIIGRNTIIILSHIGIASFEILDDTTDMVVKNTTTPTISSSAAIGIRVLVTGPFVLNSLTMDSAGAGAVARAILPNMNARYIGMFII